MNDGQINAWKKDALTHILMALAQNEKIRGVLIFKGALILNMRLGAERMSLDIDSNLDQSFTLQVPDRADQQKFLEKNVPIAVTRYFERQDPVRYELSNCRVTMSPRSDHPRGWNAFLVKITLTDNQNAGVRGLPALTIDVAAPETLTDKSYSEIPWNHASIKAYTLERIAGEKARAFLSSLPSYRAKVKKPGEAVRAKDLYDLTRIHKAMGDTKTFWEAAGNEFLLACESRYIDCEGIKAFKENWETTISTYNEDSIIPDDIPFDEVEVTLEKILALWTEMGIIPFTFPLPENQ